MKTIITNYHPYRSFWRTGLAAIALALTWAAFSPPIKADGPHQTAALCVDLNSISALSYQGIVLMDKPIMYWRLGETAGTFAYDETANHRDATYIGGPTLGMHGALPGDANTAVKFKGINQYVGWFPPVNDPVTPPNHAGDGFGSPSCSGAFTVEAWVKQKSIQSNQTFFNTHNSRGDFSFDFKFDLITYDAVQKVIRLDIGNGKKWLTTMIVPFDVQSQTWYHLVAVVTKTGATVYVNGVAVGYAGYNGNPVLFDSIHGVEIGACSQSHEMFSGVIDEVAVYDHELNACRVATHYLAGTQNPGM